MSGQEASSPPISHGTFNQQPPVGQSRGMTLLITTATVLRSKSNISLISDPIFIVNCYHPLPQFLSKHHHNQYAQHRVRKREEKMMSEFGKECMDAEKEGPLLQRQQRLRNGTTLLCDEMFRSY